MRRRALDAAVGARFSGLPHRRLLTMSVDTVESWLISPVVARHDLDNIRLEDVAERAVYAEFELQHILVQGHCFDDYGAPPRGLELELGTARAPHLQDTLVMANLGYFQIKANPGVWQ